MKAYKKLLILACTLLPLAGCDMLQRNVKTEAQLPDDRENAVSAGVNAPYRSQALDRGDITGYWTISEVAGKKAVGEEAPYLKFEKSTGRVYGNNGCNTLNSDYRVNPKDSTLSFSGTATTMRACATPGLSEVDINLALANTARYSWSRTGAIYRLTLYSADRKPLMTLVHQNYDFLNGTWTVSNLNGKALNNPDIKLVIDVEEEKIHGNTGCNILNGTLLTDMMEQGAVTFTNLATTRMMCPDIDVETELLVCLEATASVSPVNANTVNLLNSEGRVILTLTRTTDTVN